MSLNEFNYKKSLMADAEIKAKNDKRFEFQRDKGEGLEALLGSVMSYAS